MPSPKKGTPETSILSVRGAIERQEKKISGTQRFTGALKEWSNKIAEEQMYVPIETLLSDKYFWGSFNIWPSVREELEEIWHLRCDFDVMFFCKGTVIKRDTIYALSFEQALHRAREKWPAQSAIADKFDVRRPRDIHTVVIECPKGTGKDYEASIIIALLIREFLIQDREEFNAVYGLDPDTVISVNCMNRSSEQAKKVTFSEVLGKFKSPFFDDYFPPQVNIRDMEDRHILPGELRLPKKIVVFPGTGSAATGLGYCIGSGIIDEINFMEKSESSKRSLVGAAEYDAAEEVYHDMLTRHESRFGMARFGKIIKAGLVVCISSSNTDFDFTKRMRQKAEADPDIYYTSSYFWERKPLTLSGKTFKFDTLSLSILDLPQAEQDAKDVSAAPESIEAI